jgi:hypothetical protein
MVLPNPFAPTINIIAIIPAQSSNTTSSVMVPLGYSRTAVTRVALGWPIPNIRWVKNTGCLTSSRMASYPLKNSSGFVSARLNWLDGFIESDSWNYTCVVQASDTDAISTQVVSLNLRSEFPTSTPCSVSSEKKLFQVRVLTTDCQMWEEDLKVHIASDFRSEIVNTIIRVCDDCVITTQDIEMVTPTCSKQVNGAAIFKGTVSTESKFRTRVDQDCSTEDSHLECGVEFEASVSINTVAATVVVLGVL